MSNTVIQLKSSGIPSNIPGSLANGEIALNYADGKFYYKNVTGQIVSFVSGSGGGSSNSFATINANNSLVTALSNNSILTLNPGQNIGITADIVNDVITISANLKPAYDVANSAYDFANSVAVSGGSPVPAYNQANVALAAANQAGVIANASFDVANAAFATANAALPNTNGAVFNGSLTVKNNVFIGGSVTNVTQLMFNTSTNITPANPGDLTWSQDDSTLHFNTDSPGSTVLHIGQDLVFYVKNQSGQNIYKGNVCMFAGTLGASGRLTVQRAIANNAYPSKYIMGIATNDILNGNDGFVISQGKIRGIDTSMFSQGDILYVSATNPGQLTNVMPAAPNNKVTMAAVIHSDDTVGSIQVRPTYGSKINEDELAELTTLTDGDTLVYVNANGRFENKNTLVSAFGVVNAAFGSANTVGGYANTAGSLANQAGVIANAAFGAANSKVDAITSNSTTRIWANSVTVGSVETVYVDLANSGVTATTYGGATQIPVLNVDAYGRITSASNTSVQGMDYAYANTVGNNANNFAGTMANAANAYAASLASSGSGVNVSTTGPTSPTNGTLWWNTNLARLFVYYTDVDSSQWVETNPVMDSSVLISGNNWANAVGAASNTWANTVGVNANTFANTVGVNANTFANTVGVNANTYANATFYTSTNGSAAFATSNAAFAKANTSVQNNTTTLITTGYTVSSYNAGANVASYGTWTPDPANGNYQYANSNGAFTLAAPTNNCAIDILLVNGQGGAGSGAGSITFSGFTVGTSTGDTYATTANNKYMLSIRKVNNVSTYLWKALQ